MSLVLIELPYSPWSERARWALDTRGVSYAKKHYQPLLGEPALRLTTGRWTGNVTVPVLVGEGRVIADSTEIARFANTQGSGPDLFPAKDSQVIEDIIELVEPALDAARFLALERTLDYDDALLELVPRKLRGLGGIARTIAKLGVQRTIRKYRVSGKSAVHYRATLVDALLKLRARLEGTSCTKAPQTILTEFSWADITATQVINFIVPPNGSTFKIGPGSRKAFTDSKLAGDFVDLVQWRDAVYQAFRRAT